MLSVCKMQLLSGVSANRDEIETTTDPQLPQLLKVIPCLAVFAVWSFDAAFVKSVSVENTRQISSCVSVPNVCVCVCVCVCQQDAFLLG